jgi:hypothetical protein
VARESSATEDFEASCRESLLDTRRSAGTRTPYQRLKRLNDGYSLANVTDEVGQHIQKRPDAVSTMPVTKC